ncbi:MAG: hypothetical protein R3B70_16845 [Polyangiaceae bacterium]
MSTRLPWMLAVAALVALPTATGCVIVKNGGAKNGKEIATLPSSTADDRPAGFQETSGPGFWIWRGPKGWHVRTTTGGKQHNFLGEIAVRGSGVMTDLKANRTELNDRVRGNPSGAAFEFKTAGFQDGIDFKVEPGNCLEFDLKLDGKGRADRIFIGGRQTNPPSAWFKLCD